MKKAILYVVMLLLVFTSVSSLNLVQDYNNYLTRSIADKLYCMFGGSCNISSLHVDNLTVTNYVNATVIDFNITGDVRVSGDLCLDNSCIDEWSDVNVSSNSTLPENASFNNVTSNEVRIQTRLSFNNSENVTTLSFPAGAGLDYYWPVKDCPLLATCRLQKGVGNPQLTWSVLTPANPTPDWQDTLKQDHVTGTENATISTDTKLFFGDSETYYIEPLSDGMNITGDIYYGDGYSPVIQNNQYFAKADLDNDIGIYFNLATQDIEYIRNNGNSVMGIDVFGADSGQMVLSNMLLVGGAGICGTSGSGCANFSGDVYADDFISHSPFPQSDENRTILWDLFNKQVFYIEFYPDGTYKTLEPLNTTEFFENSKRRPSQRVMEWLDKKALKTSREHNYTNDAFNCENQSKYNYYVGYQDWLDGLRNCSFSLEYATQDCKIEHNKFYYHDGKGCVLNESLYCERLIWQVWRSNECVINPQMECIYNRTGYRWDWDTKLCVADDEKMCISQGCGYYWDREECMFDKQKYNDCKARECAMKRMKWDGRDCVEI